MRIFALSLFLFIPSFAILIFIGFFVKSTAYFVGATLVLLPINGVAILFGPLRKFAVGQLQKIAGRA